MDVKKINKLYQCNVCSSLLPNPSGTFMSMNDALINSSNSACVWLIRVPVNKVFLEFQSFDIWQSVDCADAYVQVYDGNSKSAPVVLSRSCGRTLPSSLVSSGSTMLVEYVTGGSVPALGFQATYNTVTCGATLTASNGSFTSPNFPSAYPSLMNCTWVIRAPVGYKVALVVDPFSLEPVQGCKYDYLIIRDGNQSTSPNIGKFCGTMTVPGFISTGSGVIIHFHSDDSIQASGFKATYAFV
ncbi:embryonic protein UVS.2-like [Protopterus annectens]|uniref:embryonic protein UVS.2-like n=1 Tax=Protopterus annectens TaxID=7888 RepID=UPI001CFADC4C|nr:embryonic protein UVS.2-like [Protopterus annectens]